MKVGTPFGDYPFVYRRVERRDGEVAVIGTVAGIESSIVFDREDALRVGKALGSVVALFTLIRALRRG